MKNTEQALAQQLIAACEALLKNTSRKDAELVRGTLDLAKAHYGTAGVSKLPVVGLAQHLRIAMASILLGTGF